ncbi:lysozyme-like [Bacillus rossius redtenbacheri]|uniref:lysozyme-like n=1 Tax=Bacillus rossius redtenbacheri TaxID=93214 RepID=UPI002FDCEBE2
MGRCFANPLLLLQPLLLLLLCVLVTSSQGRLVGKCELVRKLRSSGVPGDQLRDWVCMAQHESGMKTSRVGGPNKNGSYDYGIFQINSKYWCGITSKGKDCNIKCDDLVDGNIDDDIACAKKVHRRHGFSAWYAWRSHCQGKPLPSVAGC